MKNAQIDDSPIGGAMTSTAVPETFPLTESDAGFVYFAQPGKSLSIHMEFHLTGRLDSERLLSATQVACERHPIARARMIPFSRGDRVYTWEIQDEVGRPDIHVVDCPDERSLSLARDRLLDVAPSLDAAPPFSFGLLQGPEGDVLILRIHHAISDGLGVWRLMKSIFRSYAGIEEDPVPAFDPLQARDIRSLVVPDKRLERLRRLSRLPALLARSANPVCIAPDGGEGEGEGVYLMSFDEREMAGLDRLRDGVATINDVMLAGVALAIRRWNEEHGARSGKICVTAPVNLRPPAWAGEVPGNLASFIPVAIPKREPSSLDGFIAAVSKRTQKAKKNHTANALFDLLPGILSKLSLDRKQKLGADKPESVERLQDSAVFSNLGRLTLPDLGGEAGRVQAAWATAPAGFTRGFAIAVLTFDEKLHIALRYNRAHFDTDAAAAFVAIYRDVLFGNDTELAGSEA
jgi:NRPS condensation-like uncharacterized protein